MMNIGEKISVAGFGFAVALTLFGTPAAGEPVEVIWNKKIEVASGGGYRGPWRMNESKFNYVDDPTVAVDDKGTIAVAWADQSRKDIFFQLYEPDGVKRFEEPVNVSGSPGIFSWLPRMVLPSNDPDRIYVLWQEIVFSGGSHGGEIFFARSTDGGKSFGKPVNLSKTIAGAGKGRLTKDFWHNGSLDIAIDLQGTLYAAWTEYEGALRFSRSGDGGASFSEPMRIWDDSKGNPARGPSLAVGDRGEVFLAWTLGEDKQADIHFARSDDGGRSFGSPCRVVPSPGHADGPKLALDGEGTLHLVYAESPGGLLERYHVRYTRLKKGEETFETSRRIAGPTDRWESLNFPGIDTGGEDDIYIIWELFPEALSYPEGLGFTSSPDGGRTFASPAVIPWSIDPASASGGRQGLLMQKLAVNADGIIAVVHSTFERNNSSHIRLFRGRALRR